eukprot:TRINITY_DN11184_c0_g1_i1.p1 TRINITY_DN11184_c0_g1~~TRINITY_DN11184_c0_g1_i1.p1  ORF type:complete len:1430 (+),score=166.61 TRINITY_DN11184_c0_g1_i1:36-4325(+)
MRMHVKGSGRAVRQWAFRIALLICSVCWVAVLLLRSSPPRRLIDAEEWQQEMGQVTGALKRVSAARTRANLVASELEEQADASNELLTKLRGTLNMSDAGGVAGESDEHSSAVKQKAAFIIRQIEHSLHHEQKALAAQKLEVRDMQHEVNVLVENRSELETQFNRMVKVATWHLTRNGISTCGVFHMQMKSDRLAHDQARYCIPWCREQFPWWNWMLSQNLLVTLGYNWFRFSSLLFLQGGIARSVFCFAIPACFAIGFLLAYLCSKSRSLPQLACFVISIWLALPILADIITPAAIVAINVVRMFIFILTLPAYVGYNALLGQPVEICLKAEAAFLTAILPGSAGPIAGLAVLGFGWMIYRTKLQLYSESISLRSGAELAHFLDDASTGVTSQGSAVIGIEFYVTKTDELAIERFEDVRAVLDASSSSSMNNCFWSFVAPTLPRNYPSAADDSLQLLTVHFLKHPDVTYSWWGTYSELCQNLEHELEFGPQPILNATVAQAILSTVHCELLSLIVRKHTSIRSGRAAGYDVEEATSTPETGTERSSQETKTSLISQLTQQGFTQKQAEEALLRCSTVEAAVDWLINSSPPSFAKVLPPGTGCKYESPTYGMISASVLDYNDSDGTYNLDVRQHAAPSNIMPDSEAVTASWPAGVPVSYLSTSVNHWIPAHIVSFNTSDGTYNLDVREHADCERIRIRTPYQPRVPNLGPDDPLADSVELQGAIKIENLQGAIKIENKYLKHHSSTSGLSRIQARILNLIREFVGERDEELIINRAECSFTLPQATYVTSMEHLKLLKREAVKKHGNDLKRIEIKVRPEVKCRAAGLTADFDSDSIFSTLWRWVASSKHQVSAMVPATDNYSDVSQTVSFLRKGQPIYSIYNAVGIFWNVIKGLHCNPPPSRGALYVLEVLGRFFQSDVIESTAQCLRLGENTQQFYEKAAIAASTESITNIVIVLYALLVVREFSTEGLGIEAPEWLGMQDSDLRMIIDFITVNGDVGMLSNVILSFSSIYAGLGIAPQWVIALDLAAKQRQDLPQSFKPLLSLSLLRVVEVASTCSSIVVACHCTRQFTTIYACVCLLTFLSFLLIDSRLEWKQQDAPRQKNGENDYTLIDSNMQAGRPHALEPYNLRPTELAAGSFYGEAPYEPSRNNDKGSFEMPHDYSMALLPPARFSSGTSAVMQGPLERKQQDAQQQGVGENDYTLPIESNMPAENRHDFEPYGLAGSLDGEAHSGYPPYPDYPPISGFSYKGSFEMPRSYSMGSLPPARYASGASVVMQVQQKPSLCQRVLSCFVVPRCFLRTDTPQPWHPGSLAINAMRSICWPLYPSALVWPWDKRIEGGPALWFYSLRSFAFLAVWVLLLTMKEHLTAPIPTLSFDDFVSKPWSVLLLSASQAMLAWGGLSSTLIWLLLTAYVFSCTSCHTQSTSISL